MLADSQQWQLRGASFMKQHGKTLETMRAELASSVG